MKSFLVYKFTWASCSSSYIGENCCHFKASIEENIEKDNNSDIDLHSKYLHSTTTCLDSHNSLFFKVIDKGNSKFDFKNKETLHINYRKPYLNAQQNHLALTLSLIPLFHSVFVFLPFSGTNYQHLLLS